MLIEELLESARFSQVQIEHYKKGVCFCVYPLKPSLYFHNNTIILLYCDNCLKYGDAEVLRKLTVKEATTIAIFL